MGPKSKARETTVRLFPCQVRSGDRGIRPTGAGQIPSGRPGPSRWFLVRHIRREDFSVRDDPYAQSLMNMAMHRAKAPLDPKNGRQLVIKSNSAKQRPRKPFPRGK